MPRAGFDAAAETSVLNEIRMRLGEEIRIDLRRVREIPREANGKFRAVKSRVGGQPGTGTAETDRGGEG